MKFFRPKPSETGESIPGHQQPEHPPVESLTGSEAILAELARRRQEAARRAAKDQDPAGQIEAARQVVEAALSKADIKPEKNPDTLNRIKEELGGEQPALPPLSSGHDFLAELARRRKAQEDREGPRSS